MRKRNVYIGFIFATITIAVTSCVTEEVISTSDLPGGKNEGAIRIDSVQRIRTVESPKQMLFTQPDTTKRQRVKQKG